MQATVGALPESLLPVSQQTQPLWAPLSLPQPGEARSPCKSVPPITVPPLPCPLSLLTCWLWGLLWVGLAWPPQGLLRDPTEPGAQGTCLGARGWFSSWEYSLSPSRAALQLPLLSLEALLHWEGRCQDPRGSQAQPWCLAPTSG